MGFLLDNLQYYVQVTFMIVYLYILENIMGSVADFYWGGDM